MEKLQGLLLISGSGQKVGKTSLACEVIEKYKAKGIVALKISPHFHELPEDSQIISSGRDFRIIRETQNNNKDSSRMLMAGALKSFYVQSTDKAIAEVMDGLQEEIAGRPVVCESGGLTGFTNRLFTCLFLITSPICRNFRKGCNPIFCYHRMRDK